MRRLALVLIPVEFKRASLLQLEGQHLEAALLVLPNMQPLQKDSVAPCYLSARQASHRLRSASSLHPSSLPSLQRRLHVRQYRSEVNMCQVLLYTR